jgi:hypothetical protein
MPTTAKPTLSVNPILAEHASEIRRLGKRVVADVVEIGRRLAECKRICGHGNWLPFLDREFGWTEQTALNFIRAHDLSKSKNFLDLELPVSALYLLAAPSTPAEAREAVTKRAQAGKQMSVAEVARVVDAAKGRAQPARKLKKPNVEPIDAGPKPINGARAIMASRHEPDDSLDFFPTPPFATRALIERVLPVLNVRENDLSSSTAWESACGEGHMAEVLTEYFGRVVATDVFDYGYGEAPVDFLDNATRRDFDWIISNPPFKESIPFVLRALELARVGVAMFMRLQWLETIERYEQVFRDQPPTLVSFFVERVALCKGRWDPEGGTATAYMWLTWIKGDAPRPPFWIPPGCSEQLSHVDDGARFTTHPVTRREPPDDDGLDIPASLRRAAP